MQELEGLRWVWGVWEQGEEMGVMGKDRDGFGMVGMEGFGNNRQRGDRVGRKGSAAPPGGLGGGCGVPHISGGLCSP